MSALDNLKRASIRASLLRTERCEISAPDVRALIAHIEKLESSLKQILYLRPAGHTSNKLLIEIENIARAALEPQP